jgi:hypothetical protein
MSEFNIKEELQIEVVGRNRNFISSSENQFSILVVILMLHKSYSHVGILRVV